MQRLAGSSLVEEFPATDDATGGTGREIVPVTFVVALPGKDCVVVGADTYAFAGDEHGYVGYECSKIKAFSNRWIVGTAETNTGSTLLSRLEDADFHGSYWSVLDGCRTKTREMYERHRYIQPTSFLFCGLHDGIPRISRWDLPKDPGGRTASEHVAEAIGITGYGMQLANAYLRRDMSKEQLKLLAQFCVMSMARQDLRVRGPVELGVVSKDGARICESTDVTRYAEEANRIHETICEKFSTFT
jgi:20S proteasome alpha/beta subunit